MAKYKVFIDGESGTTGLQIRERLKQHSDIEIVSIDYDKRRDNEEKVKILREVDVTILCLPDQAAKEAAELAESLDSHLRILDASSAHRTQDGWVYGLAEMAPTQREQIRTAKKVSNPGCYATGAILMLKPLVEAGLFNHDQLISINAVSGYSGGGKDLIHAYQNKPDTVPAIGLYGLGFNHKHTAEIETWAGLQRRPLFIPSVAAFEQGMLVHSQFDLASADSSFSVAKLVDVYQSFYQGEPVINIHELNSIESGYEPYLSPQGIEGKNQVDLFVYGQDEWQEAMVVAKLDNLGKGASGAAVQNLNIMLGLEELKAVTL